MKTRLFWFASGLLGAVLMCLGLTNVSLSAEADQPDKTKKAEPQNVQRCNRGLFR